MNRSGMPTGLATSSAAPIFETLRHADRYIEYPPDDGVIERDLVRSAIRRFQGNASAPALGHRIDKTLARVGVALPARFQHVAQQKQSGKPKAVLQVLADQPFGPSSAPRRNAGSRSSRSRHGSPACRDTALPDFGDT